ncbi:MAG TPA: response regulator [Terriglobales bacterium]|jgi:DNA-binding response OmpR family regulator|nr:response regulator [Terriglobales bacterium]
MQTILAIKTYDILSHVSHSLLAAGFRVRDFDRVNVTAPQLRESATAIVIRLKDEATSAENTCLEIRKSDPQIPIMIISPRTEPSTKVRLLELGADDYLGEPFDVEELVARLRSIIRRGKFRANTVEM